MPFPINIIGIGLSLKDLSLRQHEIIQKAEVIIAGKRILEEFNESHQEKIPINTKLKALCDYISTKGASKEIVVLASGDPLFFGIGTYLTSRLGQKKVKIYPNISTLSAAFSRMNLSWANVPVISLHGRDAWVKLMGAIKDAPYVFVLTDPKNSPVVIAERLHTEGADGITMGIFETMGYPEESIQWLKTDAAMKQKFKEPNVVVLKSEGEKKTSPLYIGMPDDHYEHEKGLITKSEIRAIGLSKLRLESHHTLWDLGAGSGSVGIEATSLIKSGRVFAVEKSPTRCEQIKRNIQRFGITNLILIQEELPMGMENLPLPDRIFIGGGGKKIGEIIEKGMTMLKPDGRIVIHTILLETLELARRALRAHGMSVEIIQAQVQKSTPMPFGERLTAQNPIWILSGENR